jgi:geranylgeranyl diphosphate synthase, type I
MTGLQRKPSIDAMMADLDSELRRIVDRLRFTSDGLRDMAYYAMGWTGEGTGPETEGKRIRPMLCLLVCGGCGAEIRAALAPACAVELVHSFSLIHDDIQDGSEMRRGRPSLWKRYGAAQAINVGDAIFTLAFSALAGSDSRYASGWMRILSDTCLHLTFGQYLDLSYEDSQGVTLAQYQEMIGGKTAALVEASCRLGAVAAGADPGRQDAFARFGRALGLAFQMQDDFLGVWGDPAATGKSVASDLLARKKSLPILYGLERSMKFRSLLKENPRPEDVPRLVAALEACGTREYALSQANDWTERATTALREADPQGEFGARLADLTGSLLDRRK